MLTSKKNEIIINYKKEVAENFHGITRAVLKNEYLNYWYSGGRASAKSSKISIDIILLIILHSDINALVLRKVGATLRDSVYNQIIWAIEKLKVTHKFNFKLSPLEVTYEPTGQKIYFRGGDDPVKIKSIKTRQGYIGITWFEEVTEFNGTEEIRNILQSTNRGGSRYWNFYSYNPPKSRDNWVNAETLIDTPDKIKHHSTYQTVPREWLGEKFIFAAEQLKARRPTAYEHEYLGIPTGTGGAVFDNITERVITDEEYGTFDRFRFGIDFGFAVDEFAWIKLSYDKKHKILYVLDEIYEQRLHNDKAAEKIKRKNNGNNESAGKIHIIADSAEPKSIAEMRNYGLNIDGAKKGKDSVEYGFKFLQDLNEIVIDKRRTPNAYREFTLYEYKADRNGNYISEYPDKNDHILSAVRYAMEDEMLNNNFEFTFF